MTRLTQSQKKRRRGEDRWKREEKREGVEKSREKNQEK
jgi:hypothetical protein